MSSPTPPGPPASRWKASGFPRIRWKPSARNISGASARWGSSSARAREVVVAAASGQAKHTALILKSALAGASRPASPSQRQRDQAERADDDAPPGKQGEAVTRDIG